MVERLDEEMQMAPDGFAIPADDLTRELALGQVDSLPHVGLVGDTYTITVSGAQTGGRFCVIDMYIEPGGGPPPHRHNFEETFVMLEGEVEATFRGKKLVVRAGDTMNIPSNAAHQFRNVSGTPARILCVCAPAGLDEFFLQVGVPVATRTTPPPVMSEAEQMAAIAKFKGLAAKYGMELVREA